MTCMMTTAVVTLELKFFEDSTMKARMKDLGDIDKLKTKSGIEIPVQNSIVIEVKEVKLEPVSIEPSVDETSRKVSSASSQLLQSNIHQPITRIDDSGIQLPQHKRNSLAYHNNSYTNNANSCGDDNNGNDVTTTCHQPAGEHNVMYISAVNGSSLYAKDEKVDINGPFCEGLSGCIDDYSDYTTNDAEEGSFCLQTTVLVNYYIPEYPLSIVVEDSPLVLQDDPSQANMVPVLTSTSGNSDQYVVCHSENAIAGRTELLITANEGQVSAQDD